MNQGKIKFWYQQFLQLIVINLIFLKSQLDYIKYFYHNKITQKTQMHSVEQKFFNTELQLKSPAQQQLVKKKNQLRTYAGNLDVHINKAMNFQNRAIGRKKQNLLSTLQKMRDQIYRQSEKTRKMEEFFYVNCERILEDDIEKWDHNKDFFQKVFQLYDAKIKQKRQQINKKKQQIQIKTKQLKQILRNSRRALTVEQLSERLTMKLNSDSKSKKKQTIQTEHSTDRLTRVQTQLSLPALQKPYRVKTSANEQNEQFPKNSNETSSSYKNYMKPIKTQKSINNPESRHQLAEMLCWYRQQNIKNQVNWFEKLIFVERNFKKIKEAILQQ